MKRKSFANFSYIEMETIWQCWRPFYWNSWQLMLKTPSKIMHFFIIHFEPRWQHLSQRKISVRRCSSLRANIDLLFPFVRSHRTALNYHRVFKSFQRVQMSALNQCHSAKESVELWSLRLDCRSSTCEIFVAKKEIKCTIKPTVYVDATFIKSHNKQNLFKISIATPCAWTCLKKIKWHPFIDLRYVNSKVCLKYCFKDFMFLIWKLESLFTNLCHKNAYWFTLFFTSAVMPKPVGLFIFSDAISRYSLVHQTLCQKLQCELQKSPSAQAVSPTLDVRLYSNCRGSTLRYWAGLHNSATAIGQFFFDLLVPPDSEIFTLTRVTNCCLKFFKTILWYSPTLFRASVRQVESTWSIFLYTNVLFGYIFAVEWISSKLQSMNLQRCNIYTRLVRIFAGQGSDAPQLLLVSFLIFY